MENYYSDYVDITPCENHTCISNEITRNKGIKEINDIRITHICQNCISEMQYMVQVELFNVKDFNAFIYGYED